MSLCFFGATNKTLTPPDTGVGTGEIAIERQRMFTLGDALPSALGQYLDNPQE